MTADDVADATTIRCCDCGDTLYDDGRYDCRCTEYQHQQEEGTNP